MSGFEAGNSQGIISRNKRFGTILRGYGPPVPGAGVLNDIYIDVLTFQLFEKRNPETLDPWGHYFFIVPLRFQQTLRFFGTSGPPDSLGSFGDYYMQHSGYPNYGMNPLIYGPRQQNGWPENATGPISLVISGNAILPIGMSDEGALLSDVQPMQLLMTGINNEVVYPAPVTAGTGDPVYQEGVQGSGVTTLVTINPQYTAFDTHAVA